MISEISFNLVRDHQTLLSISPKVIKDLTVLVQRLTPKREVSFKALLELFDRDGMIAFACKDQRIISFATASYLPTVIGKTAFITFVVTLLEWENNDFAKRLILMLVEELRREDKVDCVIVQLSQESPTVRHLYETLGFEGNGDSMKLYLK